MPTRWARLAIPMTDFILIGSTRKLADTLRPPRFKHTLVILLNKAAQGCSLKTVNTWPFRKDSIWGQLNEENKWQLSAYLVHHTAA